MKIQNIKQTKIKDINKELIKTKRIKYTLLKFLKKLEKLKNLEP